MLPPLAGRWWFHIAAILIAAAYAHLRLTTNEQNPNATWEQLAALTAPVPFGHRVLIPLLARPLAALEIPVADQFLLFEFASTWLLIAAIRALLGAPLPREWAVASALVFPLFLPGAFLLHVDWPALFYPYDTPAMAFVALGLLAAFRGQRALLCLWVALAATNRESALHIPLFHGALHLGRRPFLRLAGEVAVPVLLYFAVRASILTLLPDNPMPYGGAVGWMQGDRLRIDRNLAWIGWLSNDLVLLATLGFLPLAYLAIRGKLPATFRRLAAIAGAYFLALLLIANPYEPRVFGEILVVWFFCVAAGVHARLAHQPIERPPTSAAIERLDRLVPVILALGFVMAVFAVRSAWSG